MDRKLLEHSYNRLTIHFELKSNFLSWFRYIHVLVYRQK